MSDSASALPAQRAHLRPDWIFLAVCALLFVVSAAVTVLFSAAMSGSIPAVMPSSGASQTMDGMQMSNDTSQADNMTDGAMSSVWTLMPDQSWPGAAVAFLGMWTVMMLPMMLPTLVPTLVSYRRAIHRCANSTDKLAHVGWQTLVVGIGYFFVWAVVGAAIFPVGAVVTAANAPSAVLATGLVLVLAGAFQISEWKARQLECCRKESNSVLIESADREHALRYGLKLGIDCVLCCVGLIVVLLVGGVMDLRIMLLVAAAITAERLSSRPRLIARAIGVAIIAAGIIMIYLLRAAS